MSSHFEAALPLSLYIHFPWCVKKCPYCDFNSHSLKEPLPEKAYIETLLDNLNKLLPFIQEREIKSIFMGGGTPSLFSAQAIEYLLKGIRANCRLDDQIEITLEANPGTVESGRFKAYREIGINRLSLGIQSFQDSYLKALGRIHNHDEALLAIQTVKDAGFTNFNLDLMFGLPQQTLEDAINDLTVAIAQHPMHLSWYELTLEPNTPFYHKPPSFLPEDDTIALIQERGQSILSDYGYQQYEVSAYSQKKPCLHNLNYWEFGDYLAIGAGGHAKITMLQAQEVLRFHHFRHPKQYMDKQKGFIQEQTRVLECDIVFEFFLNVLRLKKGVPTSLFEKRTGMSLEIILPKLNLAVKKGLLEPVSDRLCATPKGYRYLNDLTGIFLTES
jgi:oxygen-independent coproporphyrinogen-3 oxidase